MTFEAYLMSHIGFLLVWGFLLFPWMVLLLLSAGKVRMKRTGYLLLFLGALLIFLFDALLYKQKGSEWTLPLHKSLLSYFTMGSLLVLLLITTCLMIFLQLCILKKKKGSVTHLTIKEAVDNLPVGLAFYEDNGLVRLSNKEINRFASMISGHSLRNGREFWGGVTEKRNIQRLLDNSLLVNLEDGTTYVLKKDEIRLKGRRICSLSLNDITEEYTLNQELEQKRAMVSELNLRLKELGNRISDMTMENEILKSKIGVHDRWGDCLMHARQYLEERGNVTGEEVLSLWRRNLFQHEAATNEDNQKSRYEEILESARILGLQIRISGRLPEDEKLSPLILQAMTTCLSNTACHTDAANLFMDLQESPEKLRICFTDDGSAPVSEIQETGGLLNLRRSVEKWGGRMETECSPRFALTIELYSVSKVIEMS